MNKQHLQYASPGWVSSRRIDALPKNEINRFAAGKATPAEKRQVISTIACGADLWTIYCLQRKPT